MTRNDFYLVFYPTTFYVGFILHIIPAIQHSYYSIPYSTTSSDFIVTNVSNTNMVSIQSKGVCEYAVWHNILSFFAGF